MDIIDVQNNWLSLSEYSSEYGVSVSTLRRRIKGHKVKYKLIHGKYFLPKETSPPATSQAFSPVPNEIAPESLSVQEDKLFQATQDLLEELKEAYRQKLEVRNQQIIQLKQQISDLKTLVMYLERGSKESSVTDAG